MEHLRVRESSGSARYEFPAIPLYSVEICNSVYFTTASNFSFSHRKRVRRAGNGNLQSVLGIGNGNGLEDMTTSFWQSEHQQMSCN